MEPVDVNKTKGKKPHCGVKSRQIREYVAKNMDYFREHPVHLAWAMMHYNAIWNNGRAFGQCEDNPKYPILDLQDKFNLSEKDAGLIYDAWCATGCQIGGNFHDIGPHWDTMLKRHKTYDDWVSIKSDPQHEYSSLWPDQDSIDRNLFLTGGCGMEWTPEGYIDYTGPSGMSESLFYGFSRAAEDVRVDIRKKIEGIINTPGLDHAREWIEAGTIRAISSKPIAQAIDLSGSGWADRSLKRLPENRHKEFYDSLTFVCHYEHLMEDIIPRWKDEDWAAATGSNLYDMYGYQFDVSEITLSTCYDAQSYVSVGKRRSKDDTRALIECGYGSALTLDLDYDADDLLEKIKEANALRGWDVIKLHHKKKIENKKKWREEEESQEYSYLDSTYDRIKNFPNNAHISYVHGCIAFCDRIAKSESWTQADRKAAVGIAKRLKKRFKV